MSEPLKEVWLRNDNCAAYYTEDDFSTCAVNQDIKSECSKYLLAAPVEEELARLKARLAPIEAIWEYYKDGQIGEDWAFKNVLWQAIKQAVKGGGE